MGYKIFEPKVYSDYEKINCIGIYDNQICFVINNQPNHKIYKLSNIIKINESNFKIFFINNLSKVIFISIIKKSTYLFIEIIHCFYNYQKTLIVDSNYSKILNIFFYNHKNLINFNYEMIEDLINFLHFQDIYC